MNVLFKLCQLFLVVSYVLVITCADKTEKCDLCSQLVQDFIDGLKRTSKGNFGGGNTDWEDRKLGNYLTSETRFEEIVENICKKSECHSFLEEHEENLFKWYKNKQKQIETDLLNELCITTAKMCCPKNHFGPDCAPCPKINDLICNGNGRCDGDGKRSGSGSCLCDTGYSGENCNECADKFYAESKNDTYVKCSYCHQSCLKCTGPSEENCLSCSDGWKFNDESKLCEDVNECLRENICGKREFCQNTVGSYTCYDCDPACLTCDGFGVDKCQECNVGYKLNSDSNKCEDIDECQQDPKRCGENKKCVNKAGSFECIGLASPESTKKNNNKNSLLTKDNIKRTILIGTVLLCMISAYFSRQYYLIILSGGFGAIVLYLNEFNTKLNNQNK